jgi:hypothetical protein
MHLSWTKNALAKFLLVIFILIGFSGCNFPSIFPVSEPPVIVDEPQETSYEALVMFYVEVPVDSPENETILLSILDEVTGLALNTTRHPMKLAENGKYVIGLTFPVGTTVKYRYSRQGGILAEEHTTDGRAVRYRMYQADAPGEVHDVVARWNDTRFTGSTGRLTGTITDAATSNPIPGLIISAGGAQAITTGDGNFLIEGLPPGTHNLVAYSPDGAYRTFQHGAVVAKESNTEAAIQLQPAKKVDVTFILNVPENTPPIVPIRIAGNLHQLGNTFADLSGGVSTLAARMPNLTALPDGTYGLILGLPAGANLEYKYTLGDGFWNTERTKTGSWVVRQFTVPNEPTTIEDTVETWQVGNSGEITFDVTIPDSTPAEEIFIQFNPYGWMEPIPMWHLGGQRWAYILFSPLDKVERLSYRYCRAGQCGHADDGRTPGDHTTAFVVETAKDPQGFPDQIPNWAWFEPKISTDIDLSEIVVEEFHGNHFVAGVEFQERFHPSWLPNYAATLTDIVSLNANSVVLTPNWTFSRLAPPVLEPITGRNPSWLDNTQMIRQAQLQDLSVILKPVPQFPTVVDEWWAAAPRDFPWWVSWFDRYEAFSLHHADLADQNGVETLVLGGDWMGPALPEGKLADGNPSGVPPDADVRYEELINKIRERYEGKIGWALSYPEDILDPPAFINSVDLLYILWSEPLAEDPNASVADLQAKAERLLSVDIYSMWVVWQHGKANKDLILSVAYPSVTGGAMGCLADPLLDCIPPESLNFPAPDYPLLDLNMEGQARAYHAIMGAASQYGWIDGVVSRGYYPPTVLQDKSTSVHGKPAEEVLQAWFEAFLTAE